MMRYNLLLLALLNFNCNDLKATFMQDYKIIDLTHDVHSEIPTWDMTCGYFVKNMRDYKHCEGEFKFRSQALDIRASAGTHLDSPAHCFEGTADISQIPVDQLIVPCMVIDVSHQKDILYKATAQDILDFEKHYGEIKAGTLVFSILAGLDSGMSRKSITIILNSPAFLPRQRNCSCKEMLLA